MAKKSFVLSNGDGRVSFSNTSSVSIDDGITTGITGAISTSQLYVTTLSASSLGVSNGTGSFLSASAAGALSRSTLTGSFSSGALGWNGSAIVATNVIPGDYSGSSYPNTDISGNYSNDIKVVGVGNVFSGSLPVAYGGTGLTGSQYAASNRLILKVSGSTAPVISTLSASASGTIIASGEGRFHVQPPSYQPDVRFYGTPGTYIWTRPIGARFARVILQGAGGGGSSGHSYVGAIHQGGGGGSGGFSDVILLLDNAPTIAITVGSGGKGGQAILSDPNSIVWLGTGDTNAPTGVGTTYGVTGGTTSFGSYVLSLGGYGGLTNGAVYPAYTATGATFNGVAPSNSAAGSVGTPSTNISSGGGSGGNRAGGIVTVAGIFTNLRNFGYTVDTTGKIIDCSFVSGSTGAVWNGANTLKPSKPGYGAGAGGGTALANVGQSAGGDGGDGYALIISW